MELDLIQQKALSFLKRDNYPAIINLGMGSGKTRIVCEYLKSHLKEKVIILVPKSILLQWCNNIEEMLAECLGGEVKVLWLKKGICFNWNNLYVISINSVHLYEDLFGPGLNVFVIDEPKLLKSESKVMSTIGGFWAYCLLNGKREGCKTILLDATLLENSLDEIHCLERFLGVDDLTPHIFSPQISSPREVIKKKILIELNRGERKMEKYLEMELLRRFNYGQIAINKGIMDLLNYLNSILPNDPGKQKITVIKKLIFERHLEDQGIIFCSKLAVQAELIKILRQKVGEDKVVAFNGDLKVKERQKIMDEFNKGNIQIIVSTKAGSRGIDLPAGKYVVHFDLPMGSGEFRQRDRVTRKSSDKNCNTTIYTLMIKNSVEEVQYSILQDKIRMDREVTQGEKKLSDRLSWKKFIERKHAIVVAS